MSRFLLIDTHISFMHTYAYILTHAYTYIYIYQLCPAVALSSGQHTKGQNGTRRPKKYAGRLVVLYQPIAYYYIHYIYFISIISTYVLYISIYCVHIIHFYTYTYMHRKLIYPSIHTQLCYTCCTI